MRRRTKQINSSSFEREQWNFGLKLSAAVQYRRSETPRPEERKAQYTAELEHKVPFLQIEATTLLAQLRHLQRDSMGLHNQNSELRFRLQAMEQQLQLCTDRQNHLFTTKDTKGSVTVKMIKTFSSLRKSLVLPLHVHIRTLQSFSKYNAQAASALQEERKKPTYQDDEYADLDWDNLGFGLTPADYMYVMKCSKDGEFTEGELSRFSNIQLSPSAGVLNYGQAIYEGTKAYRKENGKLLLFRPDHNAVRMQLGAERMLMPSPSVDQFVDAVKQTAFANKRWVPPSGKGSLYIRPLLMGSGPVLGLAPAPEYTFIVYASPVGNYFKEGTAALNLYVEEEYVRAAPGGAGGVKSITNYAPVLKALSRAKSRGFSDILYLDAVKKKYLEEASSCNVFVVKGRTISTPATNGTILEGITRKSVMEIASDQGYKVVEKAVHVDEVMDADEVFCTGTAVGVAPVGTITYQDKRVGYETGDESVCQKLRSVLVGIQTGSIEDTKGWVTCIN